MAESTEKKRAKRVLDQAERHLDQALHDCQLLTKKTQKPKKLTITETVRDPITGRKKSKYSYRPRFININLRTTATTLSTTTGSEIPCTAQARLTNFVVVVWS